MDAICDDRNSGQPLSYRLHRDISMILRWTRTLHRKLLHLRPVDEEVVDLFLEDEVI
jgi:hypothetical protein